MVKETVSIGVGASLVGIVVVGVGEGVTEKSGIVACAGINVGTGEDAKFLLPDVIKIVPRTRPKPITNAKIATIRNILLQFRVGCTGVFFEYFFAGKSSGLSLPS